LNKSEGLPVWEEGSHPWRKNMRRTVPRPVMLLMCHKLSTVSDPSALKDKEGREMRGGNEYTRRKEGEREGKRKNVGSAASSGPSFCL
jgi:hypothetical protein